MREIVASTAIQPPVGPYSHAVAASGEFLFVSGQTGQDPSTGEIVTGGVATETRQVLTNLSAVLDAAGLDLNAVVKCNVFLLDMADFAEMNDVFAEIVPAPHPARSTVAVAELPIGARVEIECVAVR